jgi:hypothetical protein
VLIPKTFKSNKNVSADSAGVADAFSVSADITVISWSRLLCGGFRGCKARSAAVCSKKKIGFAQMLLVLKKFRAGYQTVRELSHFMQLLRERYIYFIVRVKPRGM